eukprot:CAMPEP_0205831678 /NCGR_PEP_ID=MMETSP0206-20130828/44768_1 /ASSEMBLY_ACC=CAM_ASM_000279 /TAXON_ID=36767 /ORGANISM="Euplotes focardii, Strain TN1" /LENGTH=75 /DNA_ID=CAMNT_0053136535 /DNA_START=214 /DNA_END=441 /DNA_ORIENTATION=-
MIECQGNAILLADATGGLVRHVITTGEQLFTEPGVIYRLDAPVSAISFDENLLEGHVGTTLNTFQYVSFVGEGIQ